MTNQTVAATREDWAEWTGRGYEVVDGGVERQSTHGVARAHLDAAPTAVAMRGRRLYTLGRDGTLAALDRASGTRRRFPPTEVTSPAALCPRGDRVTVGGTAGGTLTVYDTTLRRRIGTVDTDLRGPTALAAVGGTLFALDGGAVERLGPGGATRTVDAVPSATDLAAVGETLVVATPDGLVTAGADETASRIGACPVTPRRVAATDDRLVAVGDGDTARAVVWTPERGWTDWGRVSEPVEGIAVGSESVVVTTESNCLALSRTRQYESGEAVVAGTFDAGAEGVQWHRLTLDTTGDPERVSAHYRTGNDLPTLDPSVDPSGGDWTTAASSTDVLLRAGTGRYLQVAVGLDGDESRSPRVDAVGATCPRESLLRYLPELYQGADAAVLERLLGVFGVFFDGVDRSLSTVTSLLDPRGTPESALGWLAGWVGLDPRPEWPTKARRDRLARATELARTRGTRRGLTATVELLCSHLPGDQRVAIVEPADVPGDHHRLDGPRSVWVYAGPFDCDRHRRLVAATVDRETPAHVDATLVPLSPSATLDGSALLGVNSRLAEGGLVLGETPVGHTL